jgi:hypothetical protein
MSTTLSLFSEFDTPQATGKTAVLVRSPLRHVKGSERLLPPHNHSATSKAAAESLTTDHLQSQDRRVLATLQKAGKGGLTREEIAKRTGIELTDVCRVVNGLAGATRGALRANRPRLVEDGPDTRLSSHGRSQKIVRILCP